MKLRILSYLSTVFLTGTSVSTRILFKIMHFRVEGEFSIYCTESCSAVIITCMHNGGICRKIVHIGYNVFCACHLGATCLTYLSIGQQGDNLVKITGMSNSTKAFLIYSPTHRTRFPAPTSLKNLSMYTMYLAEQLHLLKDNAVFPQTIKLSLPSRIHNCILPLCTGTSTLVCSKTCICKGVCELDSTRIYDEFVMLIKCRRELNGTLLMRNECTHIKPIGMSPL